jgi:putative effector of murein hydrolase
LIFYFHAIIIQPKNWCYTSFREEEIFALRLDQMKTNMIVRAVELLVIIVFATAIPFAIWKGTGQWAVISLVIAVVILLKPKYANLLTILSPRIFRLVGGLKTFPASPKKVFSQKALPRMLKHS